MFLLSDRMAAKSQPVDSQPSTIETILPDDNPRKIGRSVSLSRLPENSSNVKPSESVSTKNPKRKAPDFKSSPEEKLSVKETRAKFELTKKYRIQRNAKDLSREKAKFKGRTCKKQAAEVIEDPIAKMLREMHADIKEIKLDQKKNNEKIDGLSSKVEKIEIKANETDLKIDGLSSKVESIETRANETDLRNNKSINDLKSEITNIESRVTTKLLNEMEPSIVALKDQIQESVGSDLRRLVREEMSLQKPPPSEPESSEEEEEAKKG